MFVCHSCISVQNEVGELWKLRIWKQPHGQEQLFQTSHTKEFSVNLRSVVAFTFLAFLSTVETAHAFSVCRFHLAPQSGWIVDQVDILSPWTGGRYQCSYWSPRQGQADPVFLTMDDCGLHHWIPLLQVFGNWGLGLIRLTGGLPILVCMYSKEPKRRAIGQEVGYGLEGWYPRSHYSSL